MRNLHLWFAAGLGVFLAIFAFAILRSALAESLWLDELHTSWSVSGTWQEIASRSAAGNQTPLYFWIVAFFQQTLGQLAGSQAEWILRLPSVIAWLIAIGLVVRHVGSFSRKSDLSACTNRRDKVFEPNSSGWLFALCIASWIVLDRLQWFFASEARPYAFVQLLSLAGWLCVDAVVRNDSPPIGNESTISLKHGTGAKIVVWCVLSVANIYLHLTAILPVALQWLVGSALIWWKLPQQHVAANSDCPGSEMVLRAGVSKTTWFPTKWVLAAISVGLALLPILQLAFPVWNRRSQWASFASDVSISRATSMFPFVPVLLCVLIGCVIDRVRRTKSQPMPSVTTETRWIWWSAMLGPWLVAWGVTALGIAPMFHQRFVIASALPVFIVGALELLRCRHAALVWITCLAVAISIVLSQGSASIWRAGYLVGNLRGEDWRAATRWVHERLEPGDPLLCSSGLIEANATSGSLSLPLDPAFSEYLSFPLLGEYRIVDSSGRVASVTPLLGDHDQWALQTLELMNGIPNQPTRIWMFYRGAPGRLKTKLAEFQTDLKVKNIDLEAAEPKQFGNVFVVELKRS